MTILRADRVHFEKFAVVAEDAARNSSCRRRCVGAVVFDLTGKIIATGYNKERQVKDEPPRSCWDGDCPRGLASYTAVPADAPYGDCIAVHAEIVALNNAYGTTDRDQWFVEPDIIMVVTHKPCHECTEVLERLAFPVFYLEEL